MLDYRPYRDKRIQEENIIVLRPIFQSEIDRYTLADVKDSDILEQGGMVGFDLSKCFKIFYIGKQEFQDNYELIG